MIFGAEEVAILFANVSHVIGNSLGCFGTRDPERVGCRLSCSGWMPNAASWSQRNASPGYTISLMHKPTA